MDITTAQLVTRPAARLLFSNLRLQRWCFDVELIYLAERYCMPMAEVSVNWTEIPGSKVKLMGVVLMAVELVTVRIFYSILQLWPIRCACVGVCASQTPPTTGHRVSSVENKVCSVCSIFSNTHRHITRTPSSVLTCRSRWHRDDRYDAPSQPKHSNTMHRVARMARTISTGW